MNWLVIILELLGLSLLGFLYYLYQKKKILKNFEMDVDYVTEEILFLVSQNREIEDHPLLEQLEIKMDKLKKDRVSFLLEDELKQLLEASELNKDLKEALKLNRSILLNRYEPSKKKS